MSSAISRYDKGMITKQEFCSFVAKIAVAEEIEEFVLKCPPDLMKALRAQLDEYGPDESQWPRTYHMLCVAPWVTAEELSALAIQEQEQIWNGVRLLKKCLI